MRIALCDDIKQQRDIFHRLVLQSRHYNSAMIVDLYACGEDLINATCKVGIHYDIILLDIAMGGINGIETAGIMRRSKINSIIIFITGLFDYVLQAFEVKAFRYLIKPVSQPKFDKEFGNALKEISDYPYQTFIVNVNKKIITININDLIYLESDLRKITAYTVKDEFSFYGKFVDQQNKLACYGFITINRGLLVNPAHIRYIDRMGVRLKSGDELPLSRNRRKEIYDKFTRYMLEKSV